MTSPTRSVVVRLAMEPSSYISGASRAAAATTALDREVAKVGATSSTAMGTAAASTAKAESAMGKLNKSVGVLGVSLGGLAGVGGAVAAALSVKWAGDYQQALTKLVTTAGESQKNIGSVGKAFLDMAGQVGVSADEIAKGAYIAESAGYHGADAVSVMKAATQGAAQEQADLGKVTDAVSTILHDYHLKASDAATVTSQLVAAVSHGKTTFDELTGSLHSVTPLAAKMGISIADVTGTLSAMTASGMSADQATQNMSNTLQHLASPTGTMINELAQLGISTDDLSASLSSKGLAGTLQMVEEAIVKNVDPATQKVLLPALNKSKSAAQDLQIMLGQMPPSLRKLSQGFLDGDVALSDYRKSARDLGGTQAAMGTQFMSLVTSSQGFNNEIKAGRPAAQVFTAAMQKAFGTTAALNVALQTTGENAGFTNAAIKDIGAAAAQADGNIKGWDEVQANFNQQLHQFEAGAKSLAIEAGQHLLPVLTTTFHWVDTKGIPAIEHIGSAVGDAAHWFSQLPAPVKDTAEALAVLAAANKIGIFRTLASGASLLATKLVSVFAGIGGATTSLGGLRAAGTGLLNFFGGPVVLGVAAVTAGVLASTHQVNDWAKAFEQGGKAARTAMDQIQQQEEATLAPSDWLDRAKGLWNDGIAQLQGYGSALDEAQQKAKDWYNSLSPLQQAQHDVTTSQDDLNEAMIEWGSTSQEAKFAAWQHQNALDAVRVQESLLDQATRGANGALQDQIGLQQQLAQAGVSLDQAQLSAKQSIRDYQKALKDTNLTEDDRQQALDNVAQSMFGVLDAAKKRADAETQGMPAQFQTNQEIVRQRDALDQVVQSLGFVPPALQSMYDQLNGPTAQALQATQTNVNSAGTAMTNVTEQTIPGFNKALGDLATAAGTTVPQSITGAFIPTLQGMQGELNGPTNTAVQGTTGQLDSFMRELLGFPQIVDGPFAGAMGSAQGHMGATAGQADSTGSHVNILGQIINNLPHGHDTVITADTGPADRTITSFLQRIQSQGFVGAMLNITPIPGGGNNGGNPVGLPPIPGRATGGRISGPGTGTSDSVLIAASNGEHMWTAAEVAAAGGHAAVEQLRANVLAAGRGFASGGAIPDAMTYPVNAGSGLMAKIQAAAQKQIASMAAAGTGGAARWANLVLQALAMEGQPASLLGTVLRRMNQESGGNPYAVNNWDINAQRGTPSMGLMQTIGPTFTAYHYPGTSWSMFDPLANVLASMNYALARYGSLSAAYNRAGGYEKGTSYVPETGPAVLHKGEAVLTTEQAEAYRAGLRTREVPAGGGGGIDYRKLAAALAEFGPRSLTGPVTLVAQDNAGIYRAMAELEHRLQVADLGGRWSR